MPHFVRGAVPANAVQGIPAVLARLHFSRDMRVVHRRGIPSRQQSQDGKDERFQTNGITADWARHSLVSTWVPLQLHHGCC